MDHRCGALDIQVIEATQPARLFMKWSGRGNEREPKQTLGPFLRDVIDRAIASQAAIELHCQSLTYINSSTIACIVEMIRGCGRAAVPITIRYDGGSGWQRLSFEALRVLVKGGGPLVVEAA